MTPFADPRSHYQAGLLKGDFAVPFANGTIANIAPACLNFDTSSGTYEPAAQVVAKVSNLYSLQFDRRFPAGFDALHLGMRSNADMTLFSGEERWLGQGSCWAASSSGFHLLASYRSSTAGEWAVMGWHLHESLVVQVLPWISRRQMSWRSGLKTMIRLVQVACNFICGVLY